MSASQTFKSFGAEKTAAVKTADVKTAAVKTAAVKTAAVKTAAVKTAAVKTAAVKTAAVKTAAVKTDPRTFKVADPSAVKRGASLEFVNVACKLKSFTKETLLKEAASVGPEEKLVRYFHYFVSKKVFVQV
jgi:hypothetical protein